MRTPLTPFLEALHTQAQQGTLPPPYTILHGLVLYKGHYALSESCTLNPETLYEFHDTPGGDHAGVKGTQVHAAAKFYWPHFWPSV